MLIAQISDTHIKMPGKLAYNTVDTARMLRDCVSHITQLKIQPDLILLTGDLVDLGRDEEYDYLRSILAPIKQRIIAIPGNHDERDAMRRAFKDASYLPKSGFLHYAIDGEYPFRIIGLDTLIPYSGAGELCQERLEWIDQTLQQQPYVPSLIIMHHPPFLTGIGHMDDIGLKGREEFAEIMSRHPQVIAILCGHLHRTIHTQVGGRPAMTAPSPSHQIELQINPAAPSHFCLEPPGYLLHWWNEGRLITHTALIGNYPGPFPFFDNDGKLID